MEGFFEKLSELNGAVNEFVWVKVGLFLLLGAGILTTCFTGFFQLAHLKHWWKETIGSVFRKNSASTQKTDQKSISQFQALCTALAATIGTGNIAGVSAAIVLGGPGAVFWMWVAAFFGMMTKFSENVLGIYFRKKDEQGEWAGGTMYYLKHGLAQYSHGKTPGIILAGMFAVFAIFASIGTGNMAQVNKITLNLQSAFFKGADLGTVWGIPVLPLIIGLVLTVLAGIIIIGGLQRIASFAEKIVPIMASLYVLGVLVLFFSHIDQVGAVFASIFRFAFGVQAAAGGLAGAAISKVITQGCKRGVFSNEAGLGSSVMIHASSNVREPVKQGMWGIFEVFFDTFVICTMTAVTVLSSGYIDLETGLAMEGVNDATLVSRAFGDAFGAGGEMFVAVAILLFAFTTILGWSQYGCKAVEYLFGRTASKVFRVIFVLMISSGAVMSSTLAWDISDTFNGLMMVPNLIGVLTMAPLISKITKNYVNRKIYGKQEKEMISYLDAQK